MLPGDRPVTQLAECIERSFIPDEGSAERDIATRAQRLRENPEALSLYLRGQKQDKSAFLLVIDQFEELFTFSEESERKQFDALLAQGLQDRECPLFVISTVRADFLDRYELLPRLGAIYNSHCNRHTLLTISQAGLREVIDGPAELAGLDTSEVREAILRDARDELGALPLVENALDTLWHHHRQGNRLLGTRYSERGGIVGMLRDQADALLVNIEREIPKGRAAALELLFALTKVNDEGRHTRQRVTRSEAIAAADFEARGRGERVLNLLAGTRGAGIPSDAATGALRLVVAEAAEVVPAPATALANGGNTNSAAHTEQYVDLIHETLLRTRQDEKTGAHVPYWPTLYDYVEKNRDRDAYRRQLRENARGWRQRIAPLRWLTGASWRELWSYRKRRVDRVAKDSVEARYLRASWWRATMLTMLFLALSGVLVESAWWRYSENTEAQGKLPIGYILIKPLWALGYAPLPKTVTIPAGQFIMGCKPGRDDVEGATCNDGSDLRPKEMTFDRPFGLGKNEVTFLEYDYFIWSQRRSGNTKMQYPDDRGWGRYDRPVINVSWNDAQAYVGWLSQSTGATYKLPTEAQWEYAARAGTSTGFWWGNTASNLNQANCLGCGSRWDGEQSAPVGSFPANAWWLLDTAGNVWEWVESTFWVDRGQLESWENGSRVLRGGAWDGNPQLVRPAHRYHAWPGYRGEYVGFRVSRELPSD